MPLPSRVTRTRSITLAFCTTEAEARRKMLAKKLDFVALNGPEAQGAERSSLLVLGRDGSRAALGPATKPSLARGLVRATLS